MPVDILGSIIFEGTDSVPGWNYIKQYGPVVAVLGGIKYYFGGSSNTWERDLHGKVFLVTGGTAGVGLEVVYDLGTRGAQVVLLVRSTEDSWTVDFVEDMRTRTDNFMIYAEECDLNSLHSVRKFATKWLDSKPPRRMDGVICCASEAIPSGRERQFTTDRAEKQIGINYLSHYHLLTLLSPALKVQPPDRDVRVVIATCASQGLGQIDENDILWEKRQYPQKHPWQVYGTSKLMLGLFACELQRRLENFERKDKAPCNVRVNIVNPGFMRSPSTRRFVSMGTVWGLIMYVILYPIFYLFLKSTSQGAQSIFYALYAPVFKESYGGNLVQECKIIKPARKEYGDEELQKRLFDATEKHIAALERNSAIQRKKDEKAADANKKESSTRDNGKSAQSLLAAKPTSPSELDEKLRILKNSLGVPTAPPDPIPLHPQPDHLSSQTTSSKNRPKPSLKTSLRKPLKK